MLLPLIVQEQPPLHRIGNETDVDGHLDDDAAIVVCFTKNALLTSPSLKSVGAVRGGRISAFSIYVESRAAWRVGFRFRVSLNIPFSLSLSLSISRFDSMHGYQRNRGGWFIRHFAILIYLHARFLFNPYRTPFRYLGYRYN